MAESLEHETDQEKYVECLTDPEEHHPVPDKEKNFFVVLLSQQVTAIGLIPLVGEDVNIPDLAVDEGGEGSGQGVAQELSVSWNGEWKRVDAKVREISQKNGIQCKEYGCVNAESR